MRCSVALLSGHTAVISGNQLVWGVSVGDDTAGAALDWFLGKMPHGAIGGKRAWMPGCSRSKRV